MWACSHIHVLMDKSHTYVQKHENFHIYMDMDTLLCLCQQMHLGTCAYVNVDMCINIACVHSYALM